MSDKPDRQDLEDRVEQLESTISQMLPSRRDALKLGGAALVVGAAMTGSASAGTQQAGTIGTANNPVDVESEDINNADTVTTENLVVNNTATGVAQDLQGARVFSNSNQSIAQNNKTKVTFDQKLYDNGNNFNTSTHDWTCPETGLYMVNAQIRFDGGGSGDVRIVTIGSSVDANPPSGGGSRTRFINSETSDQFHTTTINKYNESETIACYVVNRNNSDVISMGVENFRSFLEIAFVGSL